MHIIAMDDNELCLRALCRAIMEAAPGCDLQAYTEPEQALQCAKQRDVDVAFIDIETPTMNGLQLAQQLKALCPATNIVFVTGYLRYAMEAFAMHASGYVAKPVTAESIRKELSSLRYPVQDSRVKLTVRCFGRFQVYRDQDVPLRFSRSKVQELFAYLVYRRGAAVKVDEAMAALFEGRPDSPEIRNHFRVTLHYLLSELRDAGAEGAVIKEGDSLFLETDCIACDFFEFFSGDARAVSAFKGSFMSQYAWAEPMIEALGRKRRNV